MQLGIFLLDPLPFVSLVFLTSSPPSPFLPFCLMSQNARQRQLRRRRREDLAERLPASPHATAAATAAATGAVGGERAHSSYFFFSHHRGSLLSGVSNQLYKL